MKTIKIILFTAAFLIGINTNAQFNPISFGIKGGMNLSTYAGDLDGTKSKVGFHAGLTMDINLPSNFYIGSGLEFTTKGFKDYELFKSGNVKATLDGSGNAMYLQIPVHLGYKIDVAPSTKIVFHAGPYFAYGIGGKMQFDKVTLKEGSNSVTIGFNELFDMLEEAGYEIDGEITQSDIDELSKKHDTFGDDGMKRFDVGIGVGAGVEIWKFTAGIGYDFGLSDIGREGIKVNNRNGYISVGYKF